MGYRRSNYGYGGGYVGGRWRSEAWMMDGGANDEGWHHRYCNYCGKETEHGSQSTGAYCVPCDNRMVAARARRNKIIEKKVGEHTVKTYPNGKSYCSCKGFQFRKTCKHINM